MSAEQPFLGEIFMFAGNFAPVGWAVCNGQILSISQNTALFTLLGTTYGGDGEQTFGLPNLQSRIPVHVGPGFVQGQIEGVEGTSLTASQLPAHTHPLKASIGSSSVDAPTTSDVPADTTLAGVRVYTELTSAVAMSPSAIAATGADQPHENRMPFLAINFIIALEGIFPSRN
jgi:microcystin-dependent protein